MIESPEQCPRIAIGSGNTVRGWVRPTGRQQSQGEEAKEEPTAHAADDSLRSVQSEQWSGGDGSRDDLTDRAAFLHEAHGPTQHMHFHLLMIETELVEDGGVEIAVIMG